MQSNRPNEYLTTTPTTIVNGKGEAASESEGIKSENVENRKDLNTYIMILYWESDEISFSNNKNPKKSEGKKNNM